MTLGNFASFLTALLLAYQPLKGLSALGPRVVLSQLRPSLPCPESVRAGR